MMAQAAGKCLDAEDTARGKAMLAKITSASFRDWVRPMQECLLFADIRKNRPQYAIADTYIMVDERKVCSAELMFSFVALQNFAPDFKDPVLEAYLERKGAAHD